MNFKQLAFAAAVMATPFMAQAGMTAMDDSALSGVTGQDGISISGNFSGSVGNVKYTDNDAAGGSLNLTNIAFTGFSIADSNPLKIDVVTTTIGSTATEQLAISLPAMTGTVSVGGIYVGGTYANGATTGAASIGSLAISDINMSGTTIKVWGH
ncbi:MAG: hypothetical protein I8H73_26095 [Pseudomonadales bacterium]|jgi:hypothetical protein|nr:hypothetical protein [Pseudomonadales bacterium]